MEEIPTSRRLWQINEIPNYVAHPTICLTSLDFGDDEQHIRKLSVNDRGERAVASLSETIRMACQLMANQFNTAGWRSRKSRIDLRSSALNVSKKIFIEWTRLDSMRLAPAATEQD
jgi:hypothetical protein